MDCKGMRSRRPCCALLLLLFLLLQGRETKHHFERLSEFGVGFEIVVILFSLAFGIEEGNETWSFSGSSLIH